MPHPQKTHPPPTRSASICGFSLGLFLLSLSPRYSILGGVSRLAPLLHFVFALSLAPLLHFGSFPVSPRYSFYIKRMFGYTGSPLLRDRELLCRWLESNAFSDSVLRTHEGLRPGDNHQVWSDAASGHPRPLPPLHLRLPGLPALPSPLDGRGGGARLAHRAPPRPALS